MWNDPVPVKGQVVNGKGGEKDGEKKDEGDAKPSVMAQVVEMVGGKAQTDSQTEKLLASEARWSSVMSDGVSSAQVYASSRPGTITEAPEYAEDSDSEFMVQANSETEKFVFKPAESTASASSKFMGV